MTRKLRAYALEKSLLHAVLFEGELTGWLKLPPWDHLPEPERMFGLMMRELSEVHYDPFCCGPNLTELAEAVLNKLGWSAERRVELARELNKGLMRSIKDL